jgi:hypothetical protein
MKIGEYGVGRIFKQTWRFIRFNKKCLNEVPIERVIKRFVKLTIAAVNLTSVYQDAESCTISGKFRVGLYKKVQI